MAKTGPRSVSAVIEDIGYGPSQFITSFVVNGSWLADGAELLVLSSISASLSDDWKLTAIQQGWLMCLGKRGAVELMLFHRVGGWFSVWLRHNDY